MVIFEWPGVRPSSTRPSSLDSDHLVVVCSHWLLRWTGTSKILFVSSIGLGDVAQSGKSIGSAGELEIRRQAERAERRLFDLTQFF